MSGGPGPRGQTAAVHMVRGPADGARLLNAAALEVQLGAGHQVERDDPGAGVRWADRGGEGVRQPTVSASGGR